MKRPSLIRLAMFMATVVAVWGVLSLGSEDPTSDLHVGMPSPQTYLAMSTAEVEDVAETRRLEDEARASVEPIFAPDGDVQRVVVDDINRVFTDIEALVVAEVEDPSFEIPQLPEVEAPEDPEVEPGEVDEQPTETLAATISGRVFLDVDGDGAFDPTVEASRVDAGLGRVRLTVETPEGVSTIQTDAQGMWSTEIVGGAAVVTLTPAEGQVPEGWVWGSGDRSQLISCEAGNQCLAGDIGFVVSLRPIADVVADFRALHLLMSPETVNYLAVTAADDVIRRALGEPLHLAEVSRQSLQAVSLEFLVGVRPEGLLAAQLRQRTNPPNVNHIDTGQDVEGTAAVGEIVALHLQANLRLDPTQTEAAREAKAAEVQPQVRQLQEGTLIVGTGVALTEFHIAAIEATAVVTVQSATGGLLAVVAVMVGVVGLYLSKFRPEIWSRPRMVALLGVMLLTTAVVVRLTVAMADATSWYVLPVVAIGFMTAILFDQRIALLMALAVGVITAVGTEDLGLTVYAALATMAPIPFVSAVSSRGAFRNAVAWSALASAGIAAATSWFFHVGPNGSPWEVVGEAAVWAFGASAVAGLLAGTALQFFESAFDVTTTLSLLDLTDRNHKALQLLQEKAFGTFNHSLMVGTLADAAARAIGANPLLARAMAYYHDLGKTENPTYFIENQFGMQNPHDFIEPKESAQILRSHVSEGIALARQFKIPTDVAQGIVSHHGDGVMRYFYEKARAKDGDEVNVDDFRHIGHKPRTAETAILMLADSLEAACRAVFQVEEPTPEAIEKVVNRIIDEKVEDGQLSESPLTLAELTHIRKAFLDSLVGHYHQRIAYPNFPGS